MLQNQRILRCVYLPNIHYVTELLFPVSVEVNELLKASDTTELMGPFSTGIRNEVFQVVRPIMFKISVTVGGYHLPPVSRLHLYVLENPFNRER